MPSIHGGARGVAGVMLLAAAVVACGSSSSQSNRPAPAGSGSSYAVPQATEVPTMAPSGSTQPTSQPEPPAPVAPAAVPSLSFTLEPVGGVAGRVTIQPMAGAYRVTVEAAGMRPASTHAVHVHFGNCPSSGVHIVALAPIMAHADGTGSSTTTVRDAYHGDGRFLIVYAGPAPGALAACAQLAG